MVSVAMNVTASVNASVRLVRHTRLVLALDEQGWSEIEEIHGAAFNAMQTVKESSEKRVRESGTKPITGRSVQMLYELPEIGEQEDESLAG